MPGRPPLLNSPIDISTDFFNLENEYYLAGKVTDFDAGKGEGHIEWNYHRWVTDWSFNKMGMHLKRFTENEVFWKKNDVDAKLNFKLSFITPRTFRLRMKTTSVAQKEHASLMLNGEVGADTSHTIDEDAERTIFTNGHGTVILHKENFKIEVFDLDGKLLTSSSGMEVLGALHHKTIPFLFTKRVSDCSRSIASSFSLHHGEKIVGCGESFTALNKRGQKVVLCSTDVQSTARKEMYKPIPFFISSRGYGMFVHTSSPVTINFGEAYQGSTIIYTGEDALDLFFFIGSPKEILSEYTALTGRSPLPPLWSFGLWMSRFTYSSEQQVKEVATKLREHKVPCDVIHIDAGWFENGINCDYEFSKQQFPHPEKMIAELKEKGFKTSLWQLPYYTTENKLFNELVQKQLCVKDRNGNLYAEDAILDFSNKAVQQWYASKIQPLLAMGVAAIKADFGEAAPYKGLYASGRTGFYEHNLYPLRYQQLLSNIIKEITGENIIWARAAWAGCQRYPIHWGGDPEVSDTGMAGTLRGGLSLGLSGFSFWSHDIGGFLSSPKEELFKRWAFFGLLTSHSRVHGFPPREPWEFNDDFLLAFRKIVELKYRLMPYIYAQAAIASKNGWPVLRALLLEYPGDDTVWHIDDQYLFGSDILVAPLMEENTTKRKVYLPKGSWIDYQTQKIYPGNQWILIEASELPGIMLVKYGSLLPHIELAQSTQFMDWSKIELVAYSTGDTTVSGNFYVKDSDELVKLEAKFSNQQWKLNDTNNQQVFTIKTFNK